MKHHPPNLQSVHGNVDFQDRITQLSLTVIDQLLSRNGFGPFIEHFSLFMFIHKMLKHHLNVTQIIFDTIKFSLNGINPLFVSGKFFTTLLCMNCNRRYVFINYACWNRYP